jgi:cysteine desulfurase
MNRIYMDHAATTPTHPEVVKAMLPYFTEIYGNPSSLHAYGQESRTAVEDARKSVAELIGAAPEEICFTSGGTEADNFAITGTALANEKKGNHIITTVVEHHAVLETCRSLEKRGFSVTYIGADKFGMVDPDDIRKAITPKTILISVMHANNEIGTIQPVEEIGKIAREAGIYFHTDAVQTAGHLPIDVDKLNVNLLSLSAHKFYGPKGIGALYIRKGTRISPFIRGGGQEKNRRAGTENVPGIVGLGKAAEIAGKEMAAENGRLIPLRDRLIKGLLERIEHTTLNGHPAKRLPNNVNVSIAFVEGESMLLTLDMQGICASTGSACSSASLEPSHVLLATGCSHEQAHGSLRFSLGSQTTVEDIDKVLEILPPIVKKLRAMSPLYGQYVRTGKGG